MGVFVNVLSRSFLLSGRRCVLGSGPQIGVILNVFSPSGFAYGFGTHQAEIGWQHSGNTVSTDCGSWDGNSVRTR